MVDYVHLALSLIVTIIFSNWIMGEMLGTAFALFNPITLTALAVELVVAIGLGTTTIGVGNQLRNIAIGLFFGTLMIALGLDLFFNALPLVYGLIMIPIYLALGFIFLEIGKS